VFALGKINDFSSIPVLIELLKSEPDTHVVQRIAITLDELGARSAVPALKLRATDGATNTRLAVIGSIWRLGSPSDVPFLATFLDDKDGFVALCAARIMAEYSGQGFRWCDKNGCSMVLETQEAKAWWVKHGSGRE
jgi:HEAT repeat protein